MATSETEGGGGPEATTDDDEQSRLSALYRYALLDTPQESVFDELARMAARYFDVPCAVISLIDRDRIWFKARVGVSEAEVARSRGLCGTTIEQNGIRHLADATQDDIARHHPLVSSPGGLRFYAGHPLRTHDGFNIGTICVMDHAVRDLSEADREFLGSLARLTTNEIERRYAQQQLTELNRELDERVRMRTQELDGVIGDLKHEVQQHAASNAALQLSEIRQRRIAELSADFCFEIEIEAAVATELKWTTGPVEAITGYRLDEIDLLNWTRYVHDEDLSRLGELFQGASVTNNVELEYRFRCKDGEYRWFRMHLAISPSSSGPGTVSFLAAVKDLHGQRAAEELAAERSRDLEASRTQLRESRRLAWLGTIAAGMAHQINNPVGAILAAAQFALVCEGEPEERNAWRRALRTIEDEARRCGLITRNVLQFARHESPPKKRENLVEVVRSACELVESYAIERRVRLDIQCQTDWLPVHMCRTEIEEMVVNLVRNAIESGPASPIQIRLGSDEARAYARLEVSDDGCGIAPVLHERVFDPFVTTRLDLGGTGLGLSMAYGIVIDHFGEIDLKSRTERGTTLSVRLPLNHGSDPA